MFYLRNTLTSLITGVMKLYSAWRISSDVVPINTYFFFIEGKCEDDNLVDPEPDRFPGKRLPLVIVLIYIIDESIACMKSIGTIPRTFQNSSNRITEHRVSGS